MRFHTNFKTIERILCFCLIFLKNIFLPVRNGISYIGDSILPVPNGISSGKGYSNVNTRKNNQVYKFLNGDFFYQLTGSTLKTLYLNFGKGPEASGKMPGQAMFERM